MISALLRRHGTFFPASPENKNMNKIIEKNNVSNTAPETVNPASIIEPAKSIRPATLKIAGQRIEVAAIEKKLADIACEVGRLEKIAAPLKLGKLVRTMGGSMKPIIDPKVAGQLHQLELISGDAKKSKRIVADIKALEELKKALESLGLIAAEIV